MRGFVAAFSMLAAVVGAGPAIHVPAPPSVVGGPVAGATAAGSHPGEEGDGRYPVYPSRTAGTQARVPATDKPAGAARSPGDRG